MRLCSLLLAWPLGLASVGSSQTFEAWHVVGPFDPVQVPRRATPERGMRDLRAGARGPDLGDAFKGKQGWQIDWTVLPETSGKLDAGVIDLVAALPAPGDAPANWREQSVAYLYRRIRVDAPTDIAVECGSDDGMRLWLNSEQLIDAPQPRGLDPAAHALHLRLQEGDNHLLVKVLNSTGAWSFQLRRRTGRGIEQSAIDKALDRAMDELLARQLIDGSWGQHPEYRAGATAYAAFALLKCGLPAKHPAIERARAYVLANPSPFTYSASTELLFLSQLGREGDREWVERRLEDLLDYQHDSGLWMYPIHPGGHGHDDLSLTLYAALALRGVQQSYGIEVSSKVWSNAVGGTVATFEGISKSDANKGLGAGFSYRISTNVTGSMTTAGITVLEIARSALGDKFPSRWRRDCEIALEAGLNWLDGRMSWDKNPGEGGHHYFWLYGVERVGSLLAVKDLGGVDWYAEGARYLLRVQRPNGSWGASVETILAMLFLKRATAPSTGKKSVPRDRWQTDEPAAPVALAASGTTTLSVWIREFHEELQAELAWPAGAGGGMRVERVEFVATQAGSEPFVVGVSEGDPDRPASDQRFSARAQLPRRGYWEVVAKVRALLPPAQEGLTPAPKDLESPPLRVEVWDVFTLDQLRYAAQGSASPVAGQAKLRAEASSQQDAHPALNAVDGRQGSAWKFAANDPAPTLEIDLGRSERVAGLAVSHANPTRRIQARPVIARLGVSVNGDDPVELELDPDPMSKSLLRFDRSRKVRRIELVVLEVSGGQLGSVSAGLAEVELLDE